MCDVDIWQWLLERVDSKLTVDCAAVPENWHDLRLRGAAFVSIGLVTDGDGFTTKREFVYPCTHFFWKSQER